MVEVGGIRILCVLVVVYCWFSDCYDGDGCVCVVGLSFVFVW